ncbi:MAG: transposase [Muribaculaceae bacterium]|nr:transposase [Muribaculaceae bacterium]
MLTNQIQYFFVTITVIDWVDVFTREAYKNIIAESLDFCRRKKGLCIYAWVLMTNHIHLIVSHDVNNEKLSQTIGDFKKFTAKK